jgi:geranylgeranyl diphosphate synthase type II
MDFVAQFESWVTEYVSSCRKKPAVAELLVQSQEYSLTAGGKRFRPVLASQVFALFSDDVKKIRSLCLALEMIHTYSLIHDDLPCMDNDDFRRGKPSNHKKFSEDIALLAGDGLLTDVFSLLASDLLLKDDVKVALISLISEKIGSAGMVSGQVRDMQATSTISLQDLKTIHTLKTANLIQAAAVGAAIIAETDSSIRHHISEFSHALGMAFQIRDDLLDESDNDQDFKSYAFHLGREGALQELQKYSTTALHHLDALKKAGTEQLKALVNFNLQRNS